MKKILVALALTAFAQAASAALAGSAHDLTVGGGTLSACQYCHAPHNVNPADPSLPLWNRKMAPVANYTVKGPSYAPGFASLTCLSCHDGAGNLGDTYTGTQDLARGTIGTYAPNPSQAGFNLGVNISNDHPVGITYAAGASFKAFPAGLKLYSSKVECATCHDPHGAGDGTIAGAGSDHVAGGKSFLRTAITTLCTDCHIK